MCHARNVPCGHPVALADGFFQALTDASKCLTGQQRLWNMGVAGGFGVLAAVPMAAAFTLVTAAVAATTLPVWIGIGVGVAASVFMGWALSNVNSSLMKSWKEELIYD